MKETLEDQDFYARLPWPANWKSLDCNNMLTVNKTQFLDQQKYFDADKFSTCDINSKNYSQPYGLIMAFLNSLVLRPKWEHFVVDTVNSVNMLIEARPSKARLHLNLAHAQQGKSRWLAEVPSSSRLI